MEFKKVSPHGREFPKRTPWAGKLQIALQLVLSPTNTTRLSRFVMTSLKIGVGRKTFTFFLAQPKSFDLIFFPYHFVFQLHRSEGRYIHIDFMKQNMHNCNVHISSATQPCDKKCLQEERRDTNSPQQPVHCRANTHRWACSRVSHFYTFFELSLVLLTTHAHGL